MSTCFSRRFVCLLFLVLCMGLTTGAFAQYMTPGSIQVSRVQYDGNTVSDGQNDTFPYIFADPNVSGIQGSIWIDQFSPTPQAATVGNSLSLPSAGGSFITTSFSSKSEGSLQLSVNGNFMTYMGYNAADETANVSNSYDTNPMVQLVPNTPPNYDREVALVNSTGVVSLTPESNAYSGDNPRGAISIDGTQVYMVGNSDSTLNKGTNPQTGPGLSIGARCDGGLTGTSYQLGTYVATDRPDESAKQHIKDNNFRGIGIYTDANGNQNLYASKGSGGNGDDGVFQVENGTGAGLPSCTNGGADTTNTIVELWGAQATNPTNSNIVSPYTPFGFWFANPTTMYVADEGYANLDANNNLILDPLAGLEKWTLSNGTWTLQYTIQAGLNLTQPQMIGAYPVPTYATGLRNMTGVNNGDGSVTIYAITGQYSTISGGEPDPDSLVGITDTLAAAALPANEQFITLQNSGGNGQAYRGVAYIPSTSARTAQTITFSNTSSVSYGASPITLSATSTSGWPLVYSLTSGPATLTGTTLTITGAGTIVVQASQSGNSAYLPATQTQNINVSPAPITVTVGNAMSTYGGAIPSFTYMITGFVNGDSQGVVSGAPSLTTTATSASNVGQYPINGGVGSLTAANYTFSTFTQGTLTINPATLLVTPNNASVPYNQAIPAFSAKITGFVNGDTQSVVSGAPSLTTTATQGSNGGTYPISASQGTLAATNYVFTFGTGVLTITPISQNITFTQSAPQTAPYNGQFTVAATATSGLPVALSASGVCTVSSGTYTMTSGQGTCTISANQAGNTNYTAATVRHQFTTATGATPTVSFTGAPTKAPFASQFILTATTNASTSAVITTNNATNCQLSGSSSPVTVTINGDSGTCTFTATWAADTNYLAATAKQVTTLEKATPILTWTPPASIVYGTPLSSTQLDASANVGGTFTYTPALNAIENVGTDTLKVSFKPTSADYNTATTSVSIQVTQAQTATSITSSNENVTLNSSGVAMATVNYNVTTYKPTGAVSLTASTGEVCSGSISGTTGNGSCRLTFTTTGTRTVVASYSGDNNHTSSNSSSQTFTVTVNPH